MPEWKDILAALATLVASFAGAWAAFVLESHRRKHEENERIVGGANRAIYSIYHQWNVLEQYRKEVLESYCIDQLSPPHKADVHQVPAATHYSHSPISALRRHKR